MSHELLAADPVFTRGVLQDALAWSPYRDAPVGEPNRELEVAERSASVVTPPEAAIPAGYRRRRRKEPRFQAIENRLWVQWWQDGELLGRAARLVNVSRSGALIVSWTLFRENQRIRVFLEEPAQTMGVHSVVLGVLEGTSGMHQIRLAFISPCPDDFITAAANGFKSWLDCERPKI